MARKQSNPDNYKKPFPTALRTLMKDRNTTQKELADCLDKTPQAISLYCNGESAPDLEALTKIAIYFNTSTDYLLGLTSDPAKKPSAVHDLHLSPTAVDNLKSYSLDTDIVHILNLILESSAFHRILGKLRAIPKSISAEIEYTKRLENAYIEDVDNPEKRIYISDLGTLGQFMASDITTRDLVNEIVTAHPELANRIIVVHGADAIEKHIDDIGNDFANLLKAETGYYMLENIRFNHAISRSNRLLANKQSNET